MKYNKFLENSAGIFSGVFLSRGSIELAQHYSLIDSGTVSMFSSPEHFGVGMIGMITGVIGARLFMEKINKNKKSIENEEEHFIVIKPRGNKIS